MNQPEHNKRNNERHDEQGNAATSGIAGIVVELPNQQHRRDVLQLLLGLTALFGLFFSYLNWEVNFPLSLTELILAIYSLVLLFFSRSFKQQLIVSSAVFGPFIHSNFICNLFIRNIGNCLCLAISGSRFVSSIIRPQVWPGYVSLFYVDRICFISYSIST